MARKRTDLKVGHYEEQRKSVGEVVADDAPEGLDAVFPGDFLAFFVGAAGVGDGNFVDAPVAFCDFGGNFRLEAEAVGFELDALEDFATEDFVAGLHVGEFEIGENVGKQSEHLVGDVVPEIVDTLGATEETGAENYIGTAVEDGFEKFAVVARIVFEVGVLDENDVAGEFGEAAAEGCSFALILRLEQDAKVAEGDGVGSIHGGSEGFAGVLQLKHFFQDLASAVGGAIVYENDFLARLSFDDAAKDFVDGGAFVVNGNDDGEFGIDEGERVVAWMGHRWLRRKCNGGADGE